MRGFDLFGTIAYLAAPDKPRVTERVFSRLRRIGIAERVACVPAMTTAGDPRIGTLLSHRQVLREAGEAASALILSGDVLILDQADAILAAAAPELAAICWSLAHLGGWCDTVPEPAADHRHLDRPKAVRNTHAVAYGAPLIPQLLAEWPETVHAADEWVRRRGTHEDELNRLDCAVMLRPVVTTLPQLLPFEAVALQRRFIA